MANDNQVDPALEQHKLQLDYAWKWFAFHADQRVKMFNFMLLVFGVFAAGLVNALDKNLPKAAVVGLSFFAALLAVLFGQLDRRNRDLVWLAENILKQLERSFIFPDGTASILGGGGPSTWSWTTRDIAEGFCLGKHRVLLPLIAYLIAVVFCLAGVLLWIYWDPHATAPPLTVKIVP